MTHPHRKGISLKTSDKPFYPKKRFGQNFLVDPNVKARLLATCELSTSDHVLEIGPGLGALTGDLIAGCGKYTAIEVDETLAGELTQKYEGPETKIIQADFLKFPVDDLPRNLKIIGNLPYYISSPIIEKILTAGGLCRELYMTIQIDLGRRLIAQPHSKDYGSFTCFVQYYAKPELLFKIKNTAFRPIPQVQSCFMKLTPHQKLSFPATNENFLFRLIQSAFQQRRKTILKSLERIADKKKLLAAFSQLGIKADSRAENIGLREFVDLSNLLSAD